MTEQIEAWAYEAGKTQATLKFRENQLEAVSGLVNNTVLRTSSPAGVRLFRFLPISSARQNTSVFMPYLNAKT